VLHTLDLSPNSSRTYQRTRSREHIYTALSPYNSRISPWPVWIARVSLIALAVLALFVMYGCSACSRGDSMVTVPVETEGACEGRLLTAARSGPTISMLLTGDRPESELVVLFRFDPLDLNQPMKPVSVRPDTIPLEAVSGFTATGQRPGGELVYCLQIRAADAPDACLSSTEQHPLCTATLAPFPSTSGR